MVKPNLVLEQLEKNKTQNTENTAVLDDGINKKTHFILISYAIANLPRIVLSNETRQHSGRLNGKESEKRERPSEVIFFNNQGDECGGLIHQVKIKDGKIISGISFTMDNYNDNQVVQILNNEYYIKDKPSSKEV